MSPGRRKGARELSSGEGPDRRRGPAGERRGPEEAAEALGGSSGGSPRSLRTQGTQPGGRDRRRAAQGRVEAKVHNGAADVDAEAAQRTEDQAVPNSISAAAAEDATALEEGFREHPPGGGCPRSTRTKPPLKKRGVKNPKEAKRTAAT